MNEGASGSRTPEEVAEATWAESVGGVATPLLGGFSLASVIMVSDDASNFRWPGATILALTVAAVLLIAAVQFAQTARRGFEARADLPVCWRADDKETSPERIDKQVNALHQAESSARLTRLAYHIGLYALLAGLGLALAPPKHGMALNSDLRWLAVGIAAVALLAQISFASKPANFDSPSRGLARKWDERKQKHGG